MKTENKASEFASEVEKRIVTNRDNVALKATASAFMRESVASQYSYNFAWLGRPIIQYPQDIVAVQEIIWASNPDLIIETGIAHGGSLIMSASMLALLELRDAVASGTTLDPAVPTRKVVGIDIDIRPHNRAAIESHFLSNRIEMIQGSSIDAEIIEKVRTLSRGYKRVLVCLDSNHTHSHVLAELEAYAPLVTDGSYCIVFDTIVENLPENLLFGRPWSKGDNPMTAAKEYLHHHHEFIIDENIDEKLLVSVAPAGFLLRRPST